MTEETRHVVASHLEQIDPTLLAVGHMVALRRELHAHPELAFHEVRTSELIAAALRDWGIPVHQSLGTTGLVGVVQSGSSPRAIGLRADIDALPLSERNTFAHASIYQGRMHACGHDGHTAM
jgi:hippurate hydrolase